MTSPEHTSPAVNLVTMAAVGALGYLAARWLNREPEHDRYDPPGRRSGKPFIASDRVEGALVFGRDGERLGTISRLMLDKIQGRVMYAVLSSGGVFGWGGEERAISWEGLDYRPELGGYKTDLSADQMSELATVSDIEDSLRRDRQSGGARVTTYYWIVTR